MVRIMLEKPLETLKRVGQNTATQLINQNRHIIQKNVLKICLIGPYYSIPHLITKLEKKQEALYIGIMKPFLNEQINFDRLTLFRNGIT